MTNFVKPTAPQRLNVSTSFHVQSPRTFQVHRMTTEQLVSILKHVCSVHHFIKSNENARMRGPTIRIQNDIRRTWRCPVCGYERRAHANQTTIRCHCQKAGPFMKLVEEKRKPRPEPAELPPYFEYAEEDVSTSGQEASSSDDSSQTKLNETTPKVEASTPETTLESNAPSTPQGETTSSSQPPPESQ